MSPKKVADTSINRDPVTTSASGETSVSQDTEREIIDIASGTDRSELTLVEIVPLPDR